MMDDEVVTDVVGAVAVTTLWNPRHVTHNKH